MQMMNRPYTTQVAMTDTMDDAILCEGILGTTETEITYDMSGTLSYIANNGERVAAGDAVAEIYPNEEAARNGALARKLNEELKILEKSQLSTASYADMEQLDREKQTAVCELLDAAQRGNLAEAQESYGDLQLALNQALAETQENVSFSERISALTAQRDAALAAGSAQLVLAPSAGYFVSARDSDQKQFTTEQLQAMTPAELSQAVQQPRQENAANVVGKVLSDYRWSFFASVTLEQAQKFQEGDTLNISFPDISSEQMPVDVISVTVDEEAGCAKVELASDYINGDVVTLEQAQARISFETYTGLRIDKEALHVIEGVPCIFVKSGNIAYQRTVQVLYDNGTDVLLSGVYEPGVNEVRRYDTVIVEGKDLYDEKILM